MLLFLVQSPFIHIFRKPTTVSQPIPKALSHLHRTPPEAPFYTAPRYAQRVSRYSLTTHYLRFIIPHACRLTIVLLISLSPLTCFGWLACAHDDILLCASALLCSSLNLVVNCGSPSLWSNSASIFDLLICFDGVAGGMDCSLSASNSCILLCKLQAPPPLDIAHSSLSSLPSPPPPTHISAPAFRHSGAIAGADTQTIVCVSACMSAYVRECVHECVRECMSECICACVVALVGSRVK